MAYGVELHLDPETEAAVRELRGMLAAAGLPTLAGTQERPHLSLARLDPFDPDDPERLGAALADLAAGESPVDLAFPCLGVFARPAAFVFLAPVPSAALLGLHRRVHAWATGVGRAHADPYAPGRWVPHCSLTLPLTPAQLSEAVAVWQAVPFPLAGRGARLGLTRYPPVVEFHSFELGTGLDLAPQLPPGGPPSAAGPGTDPPPLRRQAHRGTGPRSSRRGSG